MIPNNTIATMMSAPVRSIEARVEFYDGSTLAQVFTRKDKLISFTVERVGESKFFGFGICHRLNVKLIDRNRELAFTTANSIEVEFGVGTSYQYPYPRFYITDVYRDEVTNQLSITAYDRLYFAASHTVAELSLGSSYTLAQFVRACGSLLGLPVDINSNIAFNTAYPTGANFEGTETIREALNAVAEATQTIYFIDWNWRLTFKRLISSKQTDFLISKDRYFELDSGANRRLAAITHATELGDNVTASISSTGTTQYVRNNPFWDLREDIGSLLNNAILGIGGLTINQFTCSWRGNPLVEIGDKIALITKDGDYAYSYLLNDITSYDGRLSQKTQWNYEDNEGESATNPATLGDALKQTYARVDKASREIELVASKTEANNKLISSLTIDTEGIRSTVSTLETNTNEAINGVNSSIDELSKSVSAKMSAEDVALQIKTELANGVDHVVTSTGFVFNETGLTVSKSNSEMETTITEDGMTVYRNAQAVLVADNEGVSAEDLHATTFLIIGKNSRLEDYGINRTGCFWIGG